MALATYTDSVDDKKDLFFNFLTFSPCFLPFLPPPQVFTFTNFLTLTSSAEFVQQIQSVIVASLSDADVSVRNKAAKTLSGFVHSGFIGVDEQTALMHKFRKRIRKRMVRKQQVADGGAKKKKGAAGKKKDKTSR